MAKLKNVVMLFSICLLFLVPTTIKAATPYSEYINSTEWQVIKIVNKERIKAGKKPLSTFKSLQRASDTRAKEIITSFSHTRPDGTSCFTIIRDKNISYYSAGENIAAGQMSPEAVMNAWMNSSGHRANILNETFSHIGAGYREGGIYGKNWTQMFVGGCVVNSVSLDTDLVKSYQVGTSIDQMDRYLVIDCSMHGKSYMPVIAPMCSGYSADKAGSQTIKVKYGSNSLSMKVKVGSSSDGSSNSSGNNGDSSQSGQNQEDKNQDGQTSQKVSAPDKVTGLKVTMVQEKSIRLKWNKKKCDGYSVYYATSKNGKYKKYKVLSAEKSSCTIKKLKSGKKFYFRVRAFNKSGNETKYGKYSSKVTARTLK